MSVPDFKMAPPDPVGTKVQRSGTLAILLACCAVLASLAWGPAILIVAFALHPSLPGNQPGVQAAIDIARQQMWAVVLVSFLALVALVVGALLAGRAAFPSTTASSRRQARWAVGCLVGGVVIGVGPYLVASLSRAFYLPLYENFVLIAAAIAGAVASFILSGIALRPAAASGAGMAGSRSAWRVGARICLLVAPLVALAVAAAFALAAQVVVGFYLLHHVY